MAARTPQSPRQEGLETRSGVDTGRRASQTMASNSGVGSHVELPEIDGYEVFEVVGKGGMGVVYRARQSGFDRQVAIKLMLSGQDFTQDQLDRFRTETEAFASLDHPNIVPVYDVGQFQGRHYFSMKYVEGGCLTDHMTAYRQDPRNAALTLSTISKAISHAHRRGFLHRDLKPANILVDLDGSPLVTDFGLAKRLGRVDGPTQTGQIMGTPSFMAPEQASGRTRDQTTATDVYSIGAILYQMLTGQAPFLGENPMEVLLRVIEQDPVLPSVLNPDVDASLQAICMKCLRKDPAERYESAQSLGDDLDAYLRGEDIIADGGTASRFLRFLLRDSRHTEVMQSWGRVWIAQGVLTILAFLLLNLILIKTNWQAKPCLTVTLPYLILMNYMVWHFRMQCKTPFNPLEKQLFHMWTTFFLCCLMLLFVARVQGGSINAIIPAGILFTAFQFSAMSMILGGAFYPVAIGCLILAPCYATAPTFGPALFGLMAGIGLIVPGRRYTRLACTIPWHA